MANHPPRKIASDCMSTFVILGIIFFLVGGALLYGLADAINGLGAAMRWAFG